MRNQSASKAAQGYLVDNSVLQKLSRSENILLNFLEISAVFPVFCCPPQVLEYCWSARNSEEYAELRKDMELLTPAKEAPSLELILDIQQSLWNKGFMRGAGNIDVMIAGYAITNRLILVHSDRDFERIASVLAPNTFMQEFIAE